MNPKRWKELVEIHKYGPLPWDYSERAEIIAAFEALIHLHAVFPDCKLSDNIEPPKPLPAENK